MQSSGMQKLATGVTDIEICFTAAFIEAHINYYPKFKWNFQL